MLSNNNAFDIRHSINGDSVVGFTSINEMKTLGWLDAPRLSTMMHSPKDSSSKYLGLINLFNTSHRAKMPMMTDLLDRAAVLEVAEGQTITYDLPVSEEIAKCMTTEDTSDQTDFPGIDEGFFKIVLTHEFTKNDFLTYDPNFGKQVIVSSEHEVERRGEGFLHYVQLVTLDREESFPKEFLKPGVAYIKLGNAMAEWDTSMSAISLIKAPGATITNEYHLSSPRSVSTFVTAKAAKMNAAGLVTYADGARDRAITNLEKMGGDAREVMFSSKIVDGNVMKPTTVGYTLEYLALLELSMMETYTNLYSRGGVIHSSNGVKRVNEGLFHQYRRGKIIKYPRPGALSLDDIREAAAYIFRNSDIPIQDRVINFDAGYYAYINVLELFREESISVASGIPSIIPGYDKQTDDTLFKGPLNNLKLQWVAITGAFIPGVGTVNVNHDPTMDDLPFSDRLNSGFFGQGKAWTTWSLTIWDATDDKYSNASNLERVKGANLVKNGDNASNIYYIKPKGSSLTWGYEQGRMADGDQTSNIRSSMPYMGREFWAISQSSMLLLDSTKFITIELQR